LQAKTASKVSSPASHASNGVVRTVTFGKSERFTRAASSELCAELRREAVEAACCELAGRLAGPWSDLEHNRTAGERCLSDCELEHVVRATGLEQSYASASSSKVARSTSRESVSHR
jgi:hypothetical protein